MLLALLIRCSTSGDTADEKVRPSPKISSFWNFFKYSMQLQFDIRYWKIVPNYARKNIFMVMTSSMTSQEDLKIVWRHRWRHRTTSKSFSIFLYEWKNNIFHDNRRTYKDLIFKLKALMYHWIVNMPLQMIVDCFIDDVIGSQNRSKLWTPIALSIFELEHRSKAQNVTNAHGYLRSIFNFRCHFR